MYYVGGVQKANCAQQIVEDHLHLQTVKFVALHHCVEAELAYRHHEEQIFHLAYFELVIRAKHVE